jgi:predicted Fe-Mo cluster-binding NifX family protein
MAGTLFESLSRGMKVAIAYWQGRVSPVFDAATKALLVELGPEGRETARSEIRFDSQEPRSRAAVLTEAGTDVLICGAISRPLHMAVLAAGVDVIPQTCGEVEQVLAAFRDGRLNQDTFSMPGCCGRRRRFQAGRRRGGRCGRGARHEPGRPQI